jgi:hypothetical protein
MHMHGSGGSADTAIWIPTNLFNFQILIYPLLQIIREDHQITRAKKK